MTVCHPIRMPIRPGFFFLRLSILEQFSSAGQILPVSLDDAENVGAGQDKAEVAEPTRILCVGLEADGHERSVMRASGRDELLYRGEEARVL